MLWFILLLSVLSFFFLRKIRQNRTSTMTPQKIKVFDYIFLLLIGLLFGTFIYILKKQFKTSYILIPYEKYFIFLLLILSAVSIVLLSLFTSKEEITPTFVYAFYGIIVFFLVLCWGILSLPVNFGSIETDTFFSEFTRVISPYREVYPLQL